ncbi:hypothetical protein KSF_105210 [Reticulibacter mediterranei]|uniref:Uncharacterized protein n=1 Tax=Reticulibacter mediterranei TaxID=2778369 RepID=A0A8J3ITV7_9CHLR|nr:hypothetical protein KSF_105210 [Reticulibacter mediterranei]
MAAYFPKMRGAGSSVWDVLDHARHVQAGASQGQAEASFCPILELLAQEAHDQPRHTPAIRKKQGKERNRVMSFAGTILMGQKKQPDQNAQGGQWT